MSITREISILAVSLLLAACAGSTPRPRTGAPREDCPMGYNVTVRNPLTADIDVMLGGKVIGMVPAGSEVTFAVPPESHGKVDTRVPFVGLHPLPHTDTPLQVSQHYTCQ